MRLLVLLAALLASAPRSDAQHVNFYRMSSNGCATGVKSDTGYSAPVIKYVWRKYRAQLIKAARGYEGFRCVVNEGDDALAEYVGLCLYAALWYMHIYPTVAAIGGWEFGRRTKRYFSKSEERILRLCDANHRRAGAHHRRGRLCRQVASSQLALAHTASHCSSASKTRSYIYI